MTSIPRQLPRLILMTDEDRLPDPRRALAALPRGSMLIARFHRPQDHLGTLAHWRRLCHGHGLLMLLAGDARLAQRLRADGVHLPEACLPQGWRRRHRRFMATAAAHSVRALVRAKRAGLDAVLVAPVFATASHPQAPSLGVNRFGLRLRLSALPVYALGGISRDSIRRLRPFKLAGFAAISALASPRPLPPWQIGS